MYYWIGAGVFVTGFCLWMWWEVKHAQKMPDDYEEYSEDWFDNNKPII